MTWDNVLSGFSALMAVGCAVAYIRLSRRTNRERSKHADNAELARLVRTSQLIVPSEVEGRSNGIAVGFALYAAASVGTFQLAPGVHIRYWGQPIPETTDKPRNAPLR